MNVAFLFGSLNRGGTETLMLDVFRSVDLKNFGLIGIYRKDGLLRNDFEKTGSKIFHLKFRSNPVKYFISLRKILLKSDIQIVHTVQSFDVLLATIACVGTKIKICQTIHGFDFNHSFLNKIVVKYSLKLTDANIYVSQYQKSYYKEKYKSNNNFVIYNGISFDKLNTTHNNELRNEYRLEKNKLLFLTVGNFNSVRNQLSLCKYAFLLKDKGVDFHWFFVGKRVENESWRFDQCVDFVKANNLSANITFLGSRNDVPQLLSQADLFVYASEHDTFGIAVVEAIASGIPVLVNDWPVMNEITNNGEYAILYKTDSDIDFLEKFQFFLSNREKIIESSINAKSKIAEKFSIQLHVESLVERYMQLLD